MNVQTIRTIAKIMVKIGRENGQLAKIATTRSAGRQSQPSSGGRTTKWSKLLNGQNSQPNGQSSRSGQKVVTDQSLWRRAPRRWRRAYRPPPAARRSAPAAHGGSWRLMAAHGGSWRLISPYCGHSTTSRRRTLLRNPRPKCTGVHRLRSAAALLAR